MRTHSTPILGAAFLMAAAFSCVAQEAGAPDVLLQDDFSGEALDEAVWVHTVVNDFGTEVVEIADGRLRMAAACVATAALSPASSSAASIPGKQTWHNSGGLPGI